MLAAPGIYLKPTFEPITLFMLKYLQVNHRQYNNIIKFKYTQYSEN